MPHFLIVPVILAVVLIFKLVYDIIDGNEPGVTFTPIFGIPLLLVVTMVSYAITEGR